MGGGCQEGGGLMGYTSSKYLGFLVIGSFFQIQIGRGIFAKVKMSQLFLKGFGKQFAE